MPEQSAMLFSSIKNLFSHRLHCPSTSMVKKSDNQKKIVKQISSAIERRKNLSKEGIGWRITAESTMPPAVRDKSVDLNTFISG
jgi:hypothetical protein